MKKNVITITVLLLFSTSLIAQTHTRGMIENTTAPMSEKVIRQRLRVMGYSNVRINKLNTLRYQIDAEKDGKPVVLHFHPQAGIVNDVTPGKTLPLKPWILPLEPPKKKQFREEIKKPR